MRRLREFYYTFKTTTSSDAKGLVVRDNGCWQAGFVLTKKKDNNMRQGGKPE